MSRIYSSKAVEAVGERVLIDVWKCFDRHSAIYGKPTEENSYTRRVNISSIAGKIMVRFEMNKVYVITCRESRNADIVIVSLGDDEIILTSDEEAAIFNNVNEEERGVCQVM